MKEEEKKILGKRPEVQIFMSRQPGISSPVLGRRETRETERERRGEQRRLRLREGVAWWAAYSGVPREESGRSRPLSPKHQLESVRVPSAVVSGLGNAPVVWHIWIEGWPEIQIKFEIVYWRYVDQTLTRPVSDQAVLVVE